MMNENMHEQIRRAFYLEHQSIRSIARERHCSRSTVRHVLADGPPPPPAPSISRNYAAPIFGPFQSRVEFFLEHNEHCSHKQRYTSHKIFETLQSEGYQGCESRIRQFMSQWNRLHRETDVFIPLEFEAGKDAQVDWGEATATIDGVKQTIQIFVMRLCYSRRTFAMAFPSQKQESFFYGHVQAFQFFGGVPARISYDNLATAVKLAMNKGRTRHENQTFVGFRSHYLFESHFCTPGQGHEKGQVEHGVGFVRRNFFVPLPEAKSFEELNDYLVSCCLRNDQRRIHRQQETIGQAWKQEQAFLRSLPPFEYDCCHMTTVRLNPYSQALYETNRYSVPTHRAKREVVIKAYPFFIEIYDRTTLLARHPRCYEKEQDIFDPLHYLSLLEQRPGAFDHAKPLRRWKQDWPESYHRILSELRERWPEGRGVQEFVRILQLHQEYPMALIQPAIEQALAYGCVHLDGVLHCLHQLLSETAPTVPLDLAQRPDLDAVGTQPIDLLRYEQLLKQSW